MPRGVLAPRALAHGARDLLEPRDALLGRGMGREQALQPAAAQRIDDEEMRRRGVLLGLEIGECPGAGLELAERARETERIAGDLGAAAVRLVLAPAGYRELHQH